MKQAVAKLRDLNIAPRKVRLVADAIRNLSVQEAEAQLLYRPQRSSEPILKLLRSAMANAKENQKLDPTTLVISKILVDPAVVYKRSLPRAQGRATPINKRRSHITIVLEPAVKVRAQRFVITKPVKTAKEKPAKKTTEKTQAAAPEVAKKTAKKDSKPGVFKKMFQRKSI